MPTINTPNMSSISNKYINFKNLHLIISLFIVIPTALIYGLSPASILPIFFDFEVNTVELTNVFRALMGLYLGISTIWLAGILKPEYWQTATIINITFMAGLAFGRIISLAVDGVPSLGFIIGLLAECVLAVYAVIQLRNNSK